MVELALPWGKIQGHQQVLRSSEIIRGKNPRLYVEIETSCFKSVEFPIAYYKGSTKCLEIKLSSPQGSKFYKVQGK